MCAWGVCRRRVARGGANRFPHRPQPVPHRPPPHALPQLVYKDNAKYAFSAMDEPGQVEALADETAALLTSEEATAETLRMQVAFDAAYFAHHSALEARKASRAKALHHIASTICAVTKAQAASFAGLKSLHAGLLGYLQAHTGEAAGWGTPGPDATPDDLAIHGEVTAALESVFPRVGLPAFVGLPEGEKRSQLEELAHLILGIRLFNWDVGKGGAGITNIAGAALEGTAALAGELETALTSASDLCATYSQVLRAAASAEAAGGQLVPPDQRAAWFAELVNRRQVCAYLGALLDEARSLHTSVKEAISAFQETLDETKSMVSGAGAVPKQQVYPKFHTLSELWHEVQGVRSTAAARKATLAALQPFLPPALCTLHLDTARSIRSAAEALPTFPFARISVEEGKEEFAPEVLSLEGAAEYMSLPLELQGYCPVSLAGTGLHSDGSVKAAGLGALVPGDPKQGIIRVGQRYVVCATPAAAELFQAAPSVYLAAALEIAAACPPLVHLLQLAPSMPQADLGALVAGGAASAGSLLQVAGDGGSSAAATAQELRSDGKCEAGVQTPVHFVEKNIVHGYTWNEWTLRQRALRLANLRNAATHGTQTLESHFTRESSAQVYLPADSSTQTAVHRGTNPTKQVRYVTGLRGFAPVVRPAAPDAAPAAAAATEAANTEATRTRAKVVSLTFDLTELK